MLFNLLFACFSLSAYFPLSICISFIIKFPALLYPLSFFTPYIFIFSLFYSETISSPNLSLFLPFFPLIFSISSFNDKFKFIFIEIKLCCCLSSALALYFGFELFYFLKLPMYSSSTLSEIFVSSSFY